MAGQEAADDADSTDTGVPYGRSPGQRCSARPPRRPLAAFASPAHADPRAAQHRPRLRRAPGPGRHVHAARQPRRRPAAPIPTRSLVGGPLAQRIYASETELGLLSDQLLALQQQRDQALADVSVAESNLRMMRDALTRAQAAADTAAGEALKAAAGLPPGEFGSDLHDLGALSQLMQGQSAPRAEAAAVEVTRAQVAEQNANSYYLAMQAKAQAVLDQYGQLDRSRQTKEAALIKLRQDNADALARDRPRAGGHRPAAGRQLHQRRGDLRQGGRPPGARRRPLRARPARRPATCGRPRAPTGSTAPA